jgi:hypothetical protein
MFMDTSVGLLQNCLHEDKRVSVGIAQALYTPGAVDLRRQSSIVLGRNTEKSNSLTNPIILEDIIRRERLFRAHLISYRVPTAQRGCSIVPRYLHGGKS